MVMIRLENGTTTRSPSKLFGPPPVFMTLRRSTPLRIPHPPRVRWRDTLDLPTYEFSTLMNDTEHIITYRPAALVDLPTITSFVDFWLSGGAKRLKIAGAGADYFVPHAQQKGYVTYKVTYLAFDQGNLIGWAVKSKNQTLIHLLVHPDYRGKGVGKNLLKIIDPEFIRSKSDQSTGNPLKFYLKAGFQITESSVGKHKNIDILKKQG